MIFLLQILSYGSFKIPKGSIILVSLISTITIGSTAVDAKLVHPMSLIIVGVTFLANTMLTVGNISFTIYHLRYAFLFIGSLFGYTGIGIAFILMIIHLSYLRSVGVPYFAPFIPFNAKEMKDVFIRGNLRKLINSKHTYPHDDKE
jgi:spore germination protein KA